MGLGGQAKRRTDFSKWDTVTLGRRAGMLCSNPDCPNPTCGPQADPKKAINLGVAAHITAALPGGPRYDPSLIPAQRNSIENAIWLCQYCHKLVDSDPRRFTVELLHRWKADAEARARDRIDGRSPKAGKAAFGDRWKLARAFGLAIALLAGGLAVAKLVDFGGAPPEPAYPPGWPDVILAGSQVNAHTAPGTYFMDCEDCPLMVVVPAGRFRMGASPGDGEAEPNERPPRTVTIPRNFAVSVYETTFRQWDAGVAAGRLGRSDDPARGLASDRGWGRGLRPVIEVEWSDANAYVQWLNQRLGRPLYRLPSEAEWEYFARAGTTTRFAFGDFYRSDRVSDGPMGTLPVGSFPANDFGLHDIHGNVWEWTADCWHDSYEGAPSDGSAWTSDGECRRHPIRGGSWGRDGPEMRLSNRFSGGSGGRRLGFRLVRDLPEGRRGPHTT